MPSGIYMASSIALILACSSSRLSAVFGFSITALSKAVAPSGVMGFLSTCSH